MKYKGKGIEGMRRIFFSVLVFILILYMMTGCGMQNIDLPLQDESGTEVESEVKDDIEEASESNIDPSIPEKGGILSIPIPQLDTLNPLLTQSKELISFFGLIYEGMFSFNEDLEPIPALVEKWKVSDDSKVWTFQLKKGIKWHNGMEVTAEDVKFTFDVLRDYPDATNAYYGQSLFKNADIASFEVVEDNPYAVVVTLNQPSVNLYALMTFPIIPKSVYQSIESVVENHKVINLELLIGTGPYKINVQNSNGENYIKLIRNTEWWDTEPYIDSIIAKIYTDNEQERYAFQNGEVDLLNTHVLFAESYATESNTRLYRYLTQSYDFIGINFKKDTLLQDKIVRQAIAYGLDRKDIISKVYFNNSLSVDVPLPLDSWLYNSSSRIYDYQPDKAVELLTNAGWSNLDDDIYLERMDEGIMTELSFTLVVDEDNSIRKDAAKIIKEQLGDIGIRVELQFLDEDTINEILQEGNFDALLAGYNLDFSGNLYFAFHSSQIGNGFNNFIGYSSEELDELLDNARITTDHGELLEVYKDIQTFLVRELPFISLYFRTNSLIVSDKVKGIKTPREMHLYNNVEEWYLEE